MEIPTIKLRDKRKPGHCWQDNELYDCFQPVIGALAVGVYARLTRECYGTTVKAPLRDLAAMCGLSKSAVQRAFAVMETVGLVVATRTSVHRSPEYALADLKELAIGYDAEFDTRRCSYILPPETLATLRTRVREIKQRLHSGGVPMGDTEQEFQDATVSPAWPSGVPQNASGVPQTAKNCDGNRLSKKARIQKETTPLPPFQKKGGLEKGIEAAHDNQGHGENSDRSDGHHPRIGVELADDTPGSDGSVAAVAPGEAQLVTGEQRRSDVDAAAGAVGKGDDREGPVQRVMLACGWVNRRLRPMIAEAIVLAAERGDAEWDVAGRMIASWQSLQQRSQAGLMRYAISPRKFIAEAHWRTDAMWPYDQEKLRDMQQASVGAMR